VGRRLTRKQIKQDEFLTLVDRLVHWMGGNWRQAAIGLGGAVVVALLWWGVGALLGARSHTAARQLAAAVAEYNAPVGAAAPADATVKFATDAERLNTAEAHFKKVASRYWLTEQAKVAKLYLARIAADRGDLDGAVRILGELAGRKKASPVVRLAMLDLITIRISQGTAAQLAADLEAMVAGHDPRLPRDVALFELARIREREGKLAEAVKLLRKLVEDFADSPYRYEAQQRLAALS
jgi:outer membrane protein assembly factor BamD (BamD/ComL family)